MLFKSLAILSSAATATWGPPHAEGRVWINYQDKTFRDAQSRHLTMHGVNVVYKIAPYIPEEDKFDGQNSLTDADIANLAKWGFNMVRLGVMWEAVEKAPGVYDDKYLNEIDQLITKLGKAGIYTLVDAH